MIFQISNLRGTFQGSSINEQMASTRQWRAKEKDDWITPPQRCIGPVAMSALAGYVDGIRQSISAACSDLHETANSSGWESVLHRGKAGCGRGVRPDRLRESERAAGQLIVLGRGANRQPWCSGGRRGAAA